MGYRIQSDTVQSDTVAFRVGSRQASFAAPAYSESSRTGRTTFASVYPAMAIPERFAIDATAIRVAEGSLAERPQSDASASGFGAGAPGAGLGAGATLGRGYFGKVTSMTYNGAPVAVKELSERTLDAASIGGIQNLLAIRSFRAVCVACASPLMQPCSWMIRERTDDTNVTEARSERRAHVRLVHQRVGR